MLGLKIRLQFAKSRHACGFALALPRPRSRGPLDEATWAPSQCFGGAFALPAWPLICIFPTSKCLRRSSTSTGTWRTKEVPHAHISCDDQGASLVRVILHRAKEEFHLLDTVGRPQSQRRMLFWSRKTRPYAPSLDYFQRNSTSSMMHTISPSRHSKEEEFDQLDAHFSQVEPSSFGDLTTRIKEETDALDHLGSVDPRRMPRKEFDEALTQSRIEQGQVSRARQALTGATLAPRNEHTREQLQNFRPQIQMQEILQEPESPVTMDPHIFANCFHSAPSGSAPGLGGFFLLEAQNWFGRCGTLAVEDFEKAAVHQCIFHVFRQATMNIDEASRRDPGDGNQKLFQTVGLKKFGSAVRGKCQGCVFTVQVCLFHPGGNKLRGARCDSPY